MSAPGHFPAQSMPANTPAAYSLAHEKGTGRRLLGTQKRSTTHYVAAPIHFVRPGKGVGRVSVTCPSCQEKVTVLVRSPGAVKLERLKRAAYIVLLGAGFYAFAVLIPWDRLTGGIESCVSLLTLFAFGIVGLYNGAQVIAPEATLLVDLPRKPLMDILPALGGRGTHSILRKKA